MKIEEIIFDEEDKNLFLIDDLQLKADAIRYSILPKLEIINNELVSRIIEFYEIDFYKNFSVGKTPHFRLAKTQRKETTKTNYTYSGVSITGQRKENKWFGLNKGTKIIPKISPSSLSIDLTSGGLGTYFYFNFPGNFTKETYEKFFNFFIENCDLICGLANRGNLKYSFYFIDTYSIKEDLELRFKEGNYDIIFSLNSIEYPINYEKINEILFTNLLFFPVLNSCIEIALGNNDILSQDIEKLQTKIIEHLNKYYSNQPIDVNIQLTNEQKDNLLQKAETKLKVHAGIRWQVFKRDNWKCVACGRSAEENIILHIDHILPRSKGGKDEMNNYQTLCETCNIGKSNKDETDLRKK